MARARTPLAAPRRASRRAGSNRLVGRDHIEFFGQISMHLLRIRETLTGVRTLEHGKYVHCACFCDRFSENPWASRGEDDVQCGVCRSWDAERGQVPIRVGRIYKRHPRARGIQRDSIATKRLMRISRASASNAWKWTSLETMKERVVVLTGRATRSALVEISRTGQCRGGV
jgi:hypothetical protein